MRFARILRHQCIAAEKTQLSAIRASSKLLPDTTLPLPFPITDGGMNLAGLFAEGANDHACSEQLRLHDFEIPPPSKYTIANCRPGLLFGVTAFEPRIIRSSLEKLPRSQATARSHRQKLALVKLMRGSSLQGSAVPAHSIS
jgi:hypothetical protein